MKKNRIYIVGMGPGKKEMMTLQAFQLLQECEVIIGYPVYLELLPDEIKADSLGSKKLLSTPMRQETKRCHMAFQEARKGKKTALVCSGDAGIYGMAALMYEIGREYPDCEITIIPGITAASSGAACLGAPINHDFCVISLSDLLTPWEKIENRLKMAALGDFCMTIYNPSSHKRADYLKRACQILLTYLKGTVVCGYVENIGREQTVIQVCTLEELQHSEVNMFTTVFIGNSQTELIDGKMVTKRGYIL